jgi:ABC-type Fe3+-hydroxamate transport system substrate-binding protein
MVNPNWEAIMDLEPDLVVATTAGNDRNAVAQAEALQLPLFFLNTPDIGSLLESLIRLGELVGHPARARALRDALTGRLERLERRSSAGPRPRVLFLVWSEPIVVPGRRTFLDDALRRTGCESISSDGPSGWPTYDLETVLLRNPEWILAAAQNAPFLDGLKERPGWRRLEAVRRGRVAAVNPALERPAPRVIEAMEQLQELLEKGEKKGPRGEHPARRRGDYPPPLPSVNWGRRWRRSSFPLLASSIRRGRTRVNEGKPLPLLLCSILPGAVPGFANPDAPVI